MSDSIITLAGTGTAGTVLTLLFLVYKTANHKKCRSRCCGREMSAEFSVGEISPVVNPIGQSKSVGGHGPVIEQYRALRIQTSQV